MLIDIYLNTRLYYIGDLYYSSERGQFYEAHVHTHVLRKKPDSKMKPSLKPLLIDIHLYTSLSLVTQVNEAFECPVT